MKRLFALLLVLVLLVGCGGASANNPKAVAQEFLNALKDGNVEKMAELTVPSQRDDADSIEFLDIEIEDAQLLKEYTGKFFKDGFKVTDAKEDGDSAIATVSFSAPKMADLMDKMLPVIFGKIFDAEYNALSEAEQGNEMIRLMLDILKDIDYESYETEFHLTKEDGKWFAESMSGKNEDIFGSLLDDYNPFGD